MKKLYNELLMYCKINGLTEKEALLFFEIFYYACCNIDK